LIKAPLPEITPPNVLSATLLAVRLPPLRTTPPLPDRPPTETLLPPLLKLPPLMARGPEPSVAPGSSSRSPALIVVPPP
jgi:hypothetical protein